MPSNKNHFVEFPPHTQLKHLILRSYLQTWVQKLVRNLPVNGRLWYVDAFAGAGQDDAGNPGSPSIALRCQDEARAAGVSLRNYAKLALRCFETDAGNAGALRTVVPPEVVTHGELSDSMDLIDAAIGASPALFFLDPFGFGLDGQVIQRCLTGDKREVLMLFNDVAGMRHLGSAAATARNADSEIQSNVLPDLFTDFYEEAAASIRVKTENRNASLEPSRVLAETRLTRAFGDESWRSHLSFRDNPERRQILLAHFMDQLKRWGATHVLSIPIRKPPDTHVYYLVHASKSAAAYRAMKESVNTALNKSAVGTDATNSILVELCSDSSALLHLVEERFAGRADVPIQELREFLLGETVAYPQDVKNVKVHLKPRRTPGRQDRYDFAAAV